MATLNQVIRERKKKFVLLKRILRAADSDLEKAERLIDRVLVRKSKVPEVADLLELVKMTRNADAAISVFLREAGQGFPV